MNKTIFAFVCLLSSVIVSAQQKTLFHDKDAEQRNVGDFHSIEVSSAIDLQLSQSDENAVAVSAEGAENREGIKTVVKNGVLKIWFESKNRFKGSSKNLRAYVSFKSLRALKASGACDVTVNGVLKGDEMQLHMSGASDFKGVIEAKKLSADLSGASDVTVRGSVSELDIDASGASRFKGYELETDNCNIDASGASDVKVNVNKVLNAHASGATNIDYRGSGMIRDVKTSGASNIRKKS